MIIKNLTYKNKNKLLILAAAVAAILIYRLAIVRTIDAWKSYSDNKAQAERAHDAPIKAAKLERQLTAIENQIAAGSDTSSSQTLLEVITRYCQVNNAVLREFPEIITSKQGDLSVETNRFVVEADFEHLLGLVYRLEQRSRLGKISSVKYLLKKDNATKETVLTATVFLQNVKNVENEEGPK